jgi:hypothetical protein
MFWYGAYGEQNAVRGVTYMQMESVALLLGVMAVTADSEKTFLMTNYNREAVRDSEDSE